MSHALTVQVGRAAATNEQTVPGGTGYGQTATAAASALLSWSVAMGLTGLVALGVLALLVAEYAALWAVLVAPWLNALPTRYPWPM
jgi:hypothetical protein